MQSKATASSLTFCPAGENYCRTCSFLYAKQSLFMLQLTVTRCVLHYIVVFVFVRRARRKGRDNPPEILKQQFDSAKAFLAANDVTQADLAYRQTIAIGLRQLGNLALSEAQYEKATGYLDEAVKQSPDDSGLQVEAAIAWFRRNDVSKAKAQIAAVLAKEPDNARAHNVLGRIYLFEGNPPASIKELNAAVAQQADFETVYFLGIAYLKAKKVPEAAELFAKLQASAGDSAALHVLFGRAYIVTHFPEPAVAEFRKAVELDPKYPRAHSLLGYAYLDHLNEQGYPLARSMFQQELKIQPDDYLTLVLLGLTDVSLRDYSAAETVLLHAARVRPDGAAPYLYLGEAYTSTQRIKEAVSALQKYVSLVHNPEEFHRDLGRGYFLLGQGLTATGPSPTRPKKRWRALNNFAKPNLNTIRSTCFSIKNTRSRQKRLLTKERVILQSASRDCWSPEQRERAEHAVHGPGRRFHRFRTSTGCRQSTQGDTRGAAISDFCRGNSCQFLQ